MTSWLVLGASLSAVISVDRTPAAADCPSAERLAAGVEAIVGSSLEGNGQSRAMQVHVHFTRRREGYGAEVRLSGAREGERVLGDNGQSCDALADAVAVTVALLFDPAIQSPAVQPSPPLKLHSAAIGVWLGGRLGLGLGLVGESTWLAGGAIGATFGPRTWLELGAATSGSYAHAFGRGRVEVRLRYAEVSGFRSFTPGAFQLGPALSVLAGATAGAGQGFASTRSATLAYIALAGGARAQLRLGRKLLLSARTLAVLPLQKQVFSVGYGGEAYRSSRLSVLAELGLAVEIW